VAFDKPRAVRRLRIDSQRQRNMQSRGFALSFSTDGERWSPPLMASDGGNLIDVNLYPVPVKKLRIHQTRGDKRYSWAIGELQVFE
jgi:hypothetical protein